MAKYRCSDCGSVYEEEKGDPNRGVAPGTLWVDFPDDYKCRECSNRKSTHCWKKIN